MNLIVTLDIPDDKVQEFEQSLETIKENVNINSQSESISESNSEINPEPVLGTGSLEFGGKRAREMRPSEFIAFGKQGSDYLLWLLTKLREAESDPRAQQSPRFRENCKLIPWIEKALIGE